MRSRNSAITPKFRTAGGLSTTELRLGDAFEKFLVRSRRRRAFPRFDGVYREVPGIQGVADFVCIKCADWNRKSAQLERMCRSLPRGPVAELIGNLSRPRRRESLIRSSSYTPRVISAALFALKASGIVLERPTGLCRLSSAFRIPRFTLYFFELKISKWQRALAQAMQAKTYANKTYCVFVSGVEKRVMKRQDLFRKLGIGVLFFDPFREQLSEPIRTRKTSAIRRSYGIDILLRLATLRNRLRP